MQRSLFLNRPLLSNDTLSCCVCVYRRQARDLLSFEFKGLVGRSFYEYDLKHDNMHVKNTFVAISFVPCISGLPRSSFPEKIYHKQTHSAITQVFCFCHFLRFLEYVRMVQQVVVFQTFVKEIATCIGSRSPVSIADADDTRRDRSTTCGFRMRIMGCVNMS